MNRQTRQAACSTRGWFGSACQYKCHCENNKCNQTTGECLDGARCDKEWFGPACQYAASNTTFGLAFTRSGSNASLPCINRTQAVVNTTTLDIHCDLNETVQQVILSGDGVKSLCSIYISGGRNVALKQNTSQTSDYDNWKSYKAVDGNREGGDDADDYCSHTKDGAEDFGNEKVPQSWTVSFSLPQLIIQYVLYNRNMYRFRLKGFNLISFDRNGTEVFNYTDENTSNNEPKYTVLAPTKQSVSDVKITAIEHERPKDRGEFDLILTLCEVEIFGDTNCEWGKYGRDCEHTCNCEVISETCFVSTGGCPSGCAAGSYGEGCLTGCPPMLYGVDCRDSCSSNCQNRTCNAVSGTCDGCIPGKRGNFCDQSCKAGFYGQNCTKNCSLTCGGNGQCDGYNGTCTNGCQPGYINFPYCNETCLDGMYGTNCSQNCSVNCLRNITAAPEICDHQTGRCLLGCVDGFEDKDCSSMKAKSNNEGVSSTIIAVVVITVVVLTILVCVIGFIILRKHKRSRTKEATEEMIDLGGGISGPNMDAAFPGGDTYYNGVSAESGLSTAIPVKGLNAFMLTCDDQYLKDQFKQIPPGNEEATFTVALSAENRRKNRYKNICPYDHSRVCLISGTSRPESDYINASHIEGFNKRTCYIASQGPNSVMVNDFIRMLWEQKVEKVVMLTNLVEEGKSKCERYWPKSDVTSFGDIKVKLAATHMFADYTIKTLKLERSGEESHTLTHFHFTSWPDKGVPINPWGLVDFQQRVLSYSSDRPVVVHCSAGIGRTGTFIALCNVMDEATETGSIDFYNTVVKLRKDRVFMIQTAEQYIFLHKAAQVALICAGTTVTSNNILERIDHLQSTSASGRTVLAEEFEAVCSFCADNDVGIFVNEEETNDEIYDVYQNSRTIDNKLKNRFPEIMPKDAFRPHLRTDTKNTDSYINAVLVPSLSKLDDQILTQLPLPATVEDFWHLVMQYNVTLVVAFEMNLKGSDSSIAEYFPLTEDAPFGNDSFVIKTGPATHKAIWEERQLTVVPTKKKRQRRTTLGPFKTKSHQLTHLTCPDTRLDPQTLYSLLAHIRSCRSSKGGRTLYMCRNGANYSGLVCVLSLLLDRMDNDYCLTVPLVVGAIKSIRVQVVPTLDQYKAIYETLKKHTEATNLYSNV